MRAAPLGENRMLTHGGSVACTITARVLTDGLRKQMMLNPQTRPLHGRHAGAKIVRMLPRSLAQALSIALLSVAAIYAQNDGAVTGVVTDSAQAVMPDVAVTVRNIETNIARKMQTNADGYFTLTSLFLGQDTATAE